MSNVPTNLIPSTITQLPEYDGSSTLGYFPYSLGGRTYKVQFSNLAAVGAVPSTRTIATGNGLQGGGDLSQNRTISIISHGVGYAQLDFTGVVAGTYGSADTIPAITVDDTGRVTAVVDTPVVLANYVPSSRTVTAGAGLTGGGQLNGNITISLNPSNATPQPLGAASAGTGTQAARDDHVHPAVDLTDTSETQGVLPLGRGGTGVDLSPVLGAVIYADNDSLNQTPAGNVGQVLTSAGGLGAPYWQTISGIGTVTSVDVSGGTTGLTTSGGPVTTVGTITIGGTLAPTSGGTGITSYAVGDLLFANTTTSLDKLTVGSNGYLLASNGTAPAYVNPTGVTVGTATNLAGGAGGSIPYQSLAGTTTFLASGTGVLTASGGNPSYTMSPSLTQVTVAADPTAALEVATKQYVDTLVASGVTYHTPVKYEVPITTGNLNATYNNGTAGVGATLTNAGTLGAFTPDGVVAQVGDRILIYNQTNAYENGVYTVTTVGSGSVAWVLTRSTDTDSYALKDPNGLGEGDAFFVTSGNTGAGETYVCNTSGTITFGTTPITFVQVSSAPVYTVGAGLTLTGNEFSLTSPVATTLGGTGLTSFTSGGAVYATSTSALTTGTLPVTAGGTGAATFSSGYLLKGAGTGAITTSVVYDNGTNVGIGTTSPAVKLDVVNGDIRAYNGVLSSYGVAGTATLNLYQNSGNWRISNPGGYLQFYDITAAAERMRLDASGNLGLGVTPSAWSSGGSLELGGGKVISFASAFSNIATNAYYNGGFKYTTTAAATLYAQSVGQHQWHTAPSGTAGNAISFTQAMTLDANGRLLIGTTTGVGTDFTSIRFNSAGSYPQGLNMVDSNASANGAYYQVFRKSDDTNIGLIRRSGTDNAIFVGGNSYLALGSGDTERMRIDSSGNVGIGTSSPGFRLDVVNNVAGLARFSMTNPNAGMTQTDLRIGAGSGSNDVFFGINSTGTFIDDRSGGQNIVFSRSGSERFRIGPSGQIGLSGANYGTSGQVLTSNGSGSAPTWQNASGGLSRAQVTAISMILGF